MVWMRSVGAGETVAMMRVLWLSSVKQLRSTCAAGTRAQGVRSDWYRTRHRRGMKRPPPLAPPHISQHECNKLI